MKVGRKEKKKKKKLQKKNKQPKKKEKSKYPVIDLEKFLAIVKICFAN